MAGISGGVIGAAYSELSVLRASLGVTSTDGLRLENLTDAAAGAQQMSPRIRFTGRGWKTNATAASQVVDAINELLPVQGAANPSSVLTWSFQVNAGGYTERFRILSGGGIEPGTTNDGGAIGSATVSWADLFLATGGVINWNNGNVTITHAAATLTFAGATTAYVFNSGPILVNASTAVATLAQRLEVHVSANYGGAILATWSVTGAESPLLDLVRSKSATIGTHSALASADTTGIIRFRGSDGVSAFQNAAQIVAVAQGTYSATSSPGKLDLYTTGMNSVSATIRISLGTVVQASATGAIVDMPAQTLAANNASSTIAIGSGMALGVVTFTNQAATLTFTDAATLYIAGIPVASTNVAITNTALAIWVDAGRSRFDDSILLGATGVGTGSPTNVLVVGNGTAPTSSPAGTVTFYSANTSANNTVPSFYCEGTGVVATAQADSASSVRVIMKINGTDRTFLCI